jgi:hypothetical protein
LALGCFLVVRPGRNSTGGLAKVATRPTPRMGRPKQPGVLDTPRQHVSALRLRWAHVWRSPWRSQWRSQWQLDEALIPTRLSLRGPRQLVATARQGRMGGGVLELLGNERGGYSSASGGIPVRKSVRQLTTGMVDLLSARGKVRSC